MNCRSCAFPVLAPVLDLGDQYLPDFTEPGQPRGKRFPLELMFCASCTLLQLSRSVPRTALYHERYGFKSGVNEAIRADLAGIVKYALSEVPRPRRWLDIACNDGTLLAAVPDWIDRTGMDPLAQFAGEARQHGHIISDYFSPAGLPVFDVITSVSMFYDLDDPNDFVSGVASVLDTHGAWVIQQNYAADMITRNAVDNVCLPPGDPVITEQGLRPIGDVAIGDKVLTHAGAYQPVNEVITRHYEGSLIEIRAYGFGHTLRVTPGHPVLTPGGFVRAADLKTGDVVGRAVPQPDAAAPADHPFDKVLAAVCGYYLAEGTIGVHGSAVGFCFGTDEAEEELAEDCLRLVRQLGIAASLQQARTGTIVQAYGWLPAYLIKHFGKGAGHKRIPAWKMDLDAAAELFRCYMAGDGYAYRGSYQRASTISQQLALDIQMLANRLGWKASITKQVRPETCIIEGRTVKQKPLWDILVHQAPVNRQKVWVEDGVQWGRVRKIAERPYVGTVVNLEVDGDRSYSTPAMTVQNCHEHITYFSVSSLQLLLRRHGLELNEVTYSDVNGGCFRALVSHRGRRPVSDSVPEAVHRERVMGLGGAGTYRKWGREVAAELALTRRFLAGEREAGRTVYLYGASTRGGTFLQMIEAGPELLPFAVERNPAKVGKIMAATGIPIISEEQMRADPPDALLVSPWFFRPVFVEREAPYLAAGGRMVFPLPRFEVVTG